MVGVPIAPGENVVERTVGLVRDGDVGTLARCLADMPDKKAAALFTIECLGQRTRFLDHVLDTD